MVGLIYSLLRENIELIYDVHELPQLVSSIPVNSFFNLFEMVFTTPLNFCTFKCQVRNNKFSVLDKICSADIVTAPVGFIEDKILSIYSYIPSKHKYNYVNVESTGKTCGDGLSVGVRNNYLYIHSANEENLTVLPVNDCIETGEYKIHFAITDNTKTKWLLTAENVEREPDSIKFYNFSEIKIKREYNKEWYKSTQSYFINNFERLRTGTNGITLEGFRRGGIDENIVKNKILYKSSRN
jgi:hypothetical protein